MQFLVGNGCYDLSGPSAVWVWLSELCQKVLCLVFLLCLWTLVHCPSEHTRSVRLDSPECKREGMSFGLLGQCIIRVQWPLHLRLWVSFHSSKEQFQYLRNPMLNTSFRKNKIAMAIKLRKGQFALTLSAVSLYFLGTSGVLLLLMLTLEKACISLFIFNPKKIYATFCKKKVPFNPLSVHSRNRSQTLRILQEKTDSSVPKRNQTWCFISLSRVLPLCTLL